MIKNALKKVAVFVSVFAMVSVLSSCNRNGYGCPYELKAPAITVVKCIVK